MCAQSLPERAPGGGRRTVCMAVLAGALLLSAHPGQAQSNDDSARKEHNHRIHERPGVTVTVSQPVDPGAVLVADSRKPGDTGGQRSNAATILPNRTINMPSGPAGMLGGAPSGMLSGVPSGIFSGQQVPYTSGMPGTMGSSGGFYQSQPIVTYNGPQSDQSFNPGLSGNGFNNRPNTFGAIRYLPPPDDQTNEPDRHRRHRNSDDSRQDTSGFTSDQWRQIGTGLPSADFNRITPGFPSPQDSRNFDGGSTVIVPGASTIIISGTHTYLGGYYYGYYTDSPYSGYSYPSVYSMYNGFPEYMAPNNIQIIPQPYTPVYYTPPAPFRAPDYPVVYKEVIYYVPSPEKAADVEAGGVRAKKAMQTAYPADSYQVAFAEIERSWMDGDLSLMNKHLRDRDVKISVSLDGKYSYSIESGDFADITRDAFDRLNTVTFKFNKVRKARSGVVTAYGKHTYRVNADISSDTASGDSASYDSSRQESVAAGGTGGTEKTVYVSYTLRRRGDQWYLIAVGTSTRDLSKSAE